MARQMATALSPALRAISPVLELGAYEALWAKPNASFTSLAAMFRENPEKLPSDFVDHAWAMTMADTVRELLKKSGVEYFGLGPDTELATIDNGAMRSLVTQLVAEKLSPKTITEMVATVKQIIGSAVDANGNQLFPRAWNSRFIDVPQIGKQKQPCATKEDVKRCLKNAASSQESLFYALLAGSGLRVAEALAIHVAGTEEQTSWNEATATIDVRSSIYRGKEQDRVKTQAAIRTVDLADIIHEE